MNIPSLTGPLMNPRLKTSGNCSRHSRQTSLGVCGNVNNPLN